MGGVTFCDTHKTDTNIKGMIDFFTNSSREVSRVGEVRGHSVACLHWSDEFGFVSSIWLSFTLHLF